MQNNALDGKVVPLIGRFYSRYRHPWHGKHPQNKGYQPRGVTVNRHDLFYGLFYGSVRPGLLPVCVAVLGSNCMAVRRGIPWEGYLRGAV